MLVRQGSEERAERLLSAEREVPADSQAQAQPHTLGVLSGIILEQLKAAL